MNGLRGVMTPGEVCEAVTDEQWQPIPDWEDRYEISDQGRVRSVRGRVVHQGTNSGGYRQVFLWRDYKRTAYRVHNLVLRTFRGDRETDQVGRHLNGVKTDNRLANLAWGSASENSRDAVRHGQHPQARKTHCQKGHPLSGDNVRLLPQSRGTGYYRRCRQCEREQWARGNEKRRRAS